MSFSRVLNLYLNLDAQTGNPLVTGLNNIAPRSAPQFIQGDTLRVRLWPRTETGDATSPLITSRLAVGTIPVLAAKAASALDAATLLFSATTWSETNTIPADNTGDWYYEATLNLNTTELDTAIAALSVTATSLAIKIDIELQNSDNTERLTYQLDATALRQVYNGEASPTPGTPTYPPPSNIVTGTGITFVTAPATKTDLTVLPGGVAPATGKTYIAIGATGIWTIRNPETEWRFTDRATI